MKEIPFHYSIVGHALAGRLYFTFSTIEFQMGQVSLKTGVREISSAILDDTIWGPLLTWFNLNPNMEK